MGTNTEKHIFPSHKEVCEANLYLPARKDPPPVIVMAHGFGAERNFGTRKVTRAFQDAGYAVFNFDYRCFGGSQGKPRQLIDPARHCEDWSSAIKYVRSLRNVDGTRLVLWGSSYSGGHVLTKAAEHHKISGVIAQVPFCNSRSVAANTPMGKKLKGVLHAVTDTLCSLVGREHRIPIVGKPGAGFAIMDWPGWYDDYIKIARLSRTWENSTPARSLLRGSGYNPGDEASNIKCPTLIISGSKDQAIPREDVLEVAAKIRNCEHVELDFDHFELYDDFELNGKAIAIQLRFLDRIFATNQTENVANQ